MAKRNLTLLIFLISITARADLVAQESDNFFPHAVGNTWQYMYNDGRMLQEKIIRDSIDYFGNTFINYGVTYPQFYWSIKVNTTSDSIYYLPKTINQLLYKFPIDSNEIFSIDTSDIYGYYGKVYDIYTTNIFGLFKKVIEIRYFLGHPDSIYSGWLYTHKIAEGLGKIWYGDEVEYYGIIGCVIDGDTLGIIISDIETDSNLKVPVNIELEQNYPNPFNPSTTISYSLVETIKLKLLVYNLLGEKIEVLAEGEYPAGNYKVSFNPTQIPAGLYFYSLITEGQRITKKMIYLK